MGIDEALVHFQSKLPYAVSVFTLHPDECEQCFPKFFLSLDSLKDQISKNVSVMYPVQFFVRNSTTWTDGESICNVTDNRSMGEYGHYNFTIQHENCTLIETEEPVNSYLPILWCALFFLGLAVVWNLGQFLYSKYKQCRRSTVTSSSMELQSNSPTITEKPPPKERLRSIDTFRGICIVIMIFVNQGGAGYWFFEHTIWNGLLVADLVFPWFLWVMGVCMPISFRSMMKRKTKKWTMFRRVLRRSIYLFLLGIITGAGNRIDYLRIFGVLQRFAVTYFIVALLFILIPYWYYKDVQEDSRWYFLKDVIRIFPHWLVIICLVIVHTLIIFLVEPPGCPRGYLGPGGRHMHGEYWNCTGGSTGYLDRSILGANHLYQRPTIKVVYESPHPFDPEGIIAILTSLLQVYLGVQAGLTLITFTEWKDRAKRWILWGTGTGIFALILCKGTQDTGFIPLNKNLWSLSFTLATSCLAFYLLSFCYFVIDVKKWWNGGPFYMPGMNSIILYCGHQVSYQFFPFTWRIDNMDSHGILLIAHVWTTTMWVLVAVWLYYIPFFLAL